jgi:hypothetical protein
MAPSSSYREIYIGDQYDCTSMVMHRPPRPPLTPLCHELRIHPHHLGSTFRGLLKEDGDR